MVLETAKALWQRLEPKRQPYMQRAQDASSLTLPFMFPPTFDMEGRSMPEHTAQLHLPTPYQSVGSRGVNNVASKFVVGLVPPNSPFFRLELERILFEQRFGAEQLQAGEQGLVVIENAIMSEIETMHLRPTAFEAFSHLAVSGNGMLEVPDTGPAIFWPLPTFVVERDPSDNLLRIVMRVEVSLERLPLRARQAALQATAVRSAIPTDQVGKKPVVLYTRLERMSNERWMGWQEFENGTEVPDTRGAWDEEDFPYIVLRWNRVAGEHYARGLVEQNLGDLRSLEGLMQAIVQAAAGAAHHVWLVNPNGPSRAQDVQGAPTGAFRAGRAEDFTVLRLEKAADMAVAQGVAAGLENRLGRAFLMLEGSIRDAERVTTIEIDQVVQELNENLGGVFATQSAEFQLPLVRRVMGRMARRRALPVIPRGIVTPKIITGIEGIGRGAELARLSRALQLMANTKPEMLQAIDDRELATRILNGSGVQSDGLLLDPEVLAQQQQRQNMQEFMQSPAGAQLLQQFGGLVQGAQQQQQQAA